LARAWKLSSLVYAWRSATLMASLFPSLRVPRTTVMRRLAQLQSWGLIDRQGRHYYLHEKALNSLIGMRSYQQVRRIALSRKAALPLAACCLRRQLDLQPRATALTVGGS
jgi:DNA-binding IclR family transcriptional regulator